MECCNYSDVIFVFLYNFQTLLTGILAVIAAIITSVAIWRSTNAPIKEERKRLQRLQESKRCYLGQELSFHLRIISSRAEDALSTIKVYAASKKDITDNVRTRCLISLDPIFTQWEFMSLLTGEEFNELADLRRKIADHNFSISKTAGAFGDDNHKENLKKRLEQIKTGAGKLGTTLLVNSH